MTDTRSASARRPASTPPGGRTGKSPTGSWPVRERSLVKPVLGIPPGAAVAIAVGLTAVGVVADLIRIGTVGAIFKVGYFLGCVLAVAWVRRRGIFLPAIQPPLLLAVVVPAIAVLIGAPTPEAGATEHLLMAGAPLINAFPAMAVTTAVVLLLAGLRLMRQRTGPDDAVGRLRRRLSGGRAEGSAGRGDAAGKQASGTARTTSGRSTSGRSTAGAAGSGRTTAGRTTSAGSTSEGPSSGRTASGRTGSGRTGSSRTGSSRTASSGTASGRTTSARNTSGATSSGRPEPRTGASRSPTGSPRDGDPAPSRRPRRG